MSENEAVSDGGDGEEPPRWRDWSNVKEERDGRLMTDGGENVSERAPLRDSVEVVRLDDGRFKVQNDAGVGIPLEPEEAEVVAEFIQSGTTGPVRRRYKELQSVYRELIQRHQKLKSRANSFEFEHDDEHERRELAEIEAARDECIENIQRVEELLNEWNAEDEERNRGDE